MIVRGQWMDAIDQRDANGNLTALALAVDAVRDNGCDCGTDEAGTCLACRCEVALKESWTRAEAHAAFLSWLDAEIEAARTEATRSALERVKARLCG